MAEPLSVIVNIFKFICNRKMYNTNDNYKNVISFFFLLQKFLEMFEFKQIG